MSARRRRKILAFATVKSHFSITKSLLLNGFRHENTPKVSQISIQQYQNPLSQNPTVLLSDFRKCRILVSDFSEPKVSNPTVLLFKKKGLFWIPKI